MTMVIIWLSLFVVTLAIELSTAALVSIWFTAGSLASLLLAAFLGDKLIWLQILVFIIVSVSTIVLLRPLVFRNKKQNTKTNVDSIIGKIGTCVKQIQKYENGEVKIESLTWTGKLSENTEEPIMEGTLVKVLEVKGNKLIVEKYEEN